MAASRQMAQCSVSGTPHRSPERTRSSSSHVAATIAITVALLAGCGLPEQPHIESVLAANAVVKPGTAVQMRATVTAVGAIDESVDWTLAPGAQGKVTADGVYEGPRTPGLYRLIVRSKADPNKGDYADVVVTDADNVAPPPAEPDPIPPESTVPAAQTVVPPDPTVTATPEPAPTVTPDPTPLPTTEPSPTPVVSPSPTPTATPTPTPTATPTPTPTPTATATSTPTTAPTAMSLGQPLGAFPGCQGSGCQTRGGFAAGSTVYFVDSLAAGRAGCTASNGVATGCRLGDCVAASGPRVCLFRVSGTIASSGYLISNGSITIDARSAPGEGIHISQVDGNSSLAVFRVAASDVVVRGVKIRPGRNPVNNGDNAGVRGVNLINTNMSRIVFDHNSMQWGNGGNISVWGDQPIDQVTFSWNIVGEGLDLTQTDAAPWNEVNGSYNINTGASTQTASDAITNLDFHHNYFANNNDRTIKFRTKTGRIVNNVFYNGGAIEFIGGSNVDIINNSFRLGPSSTSYYSGGSAHSPIVLWYEGYGPIVSWPTGTPTYYVAGNADPSIDDGSANWISGMAKICTISGSCSVSTAYRRTTALGSAGIAITPDATNAALGAPGASTGTPTGSGVRGSAGAVQRLDCGGALVMRRDALDQRLVNSFPVDSGFGSGLADAVPFSEVYRQISTNTQNPEGGFPAIREVTTTCSPGSRDNSACKCADSDNDGMPDYWETYWCGGPTACSRTSSTVIASPGYTNLEAYLSGLAPVP